MLDSGKLCGTATTSGTLKYLESSSVREFVITQWKICAHSSRESGCRRKFVRAFIFGVNFTAPTSAAFWKTSGPWCKRITRHGSVPKKE